MAIFDLTRAHIVLPQVQRLTADAVQTVESLLKEAEGLDSNHPRLPVIKEKVKQAIAFWTDAILALGADVKGLWLVDFDDGQGGYYCWKYPEESLDYWHSYEGGFAAREPIAPPELH